MSWISRLVSGGLGELVEGIGSVADKFIRTREEKDQFLLQVNALIQDQNRNLEESFRQELQAKERILVAELQQGDNYTKRARPTIIYTGLIFIGIELVARAVALYHFVSLATIDKLGESITAAAALPTLLPAEFWWAWGAVVGVYKIGRSFEKRGAGGKILEAVTGKKQASLLTD